MTYTEETDYAEATQAKRLSPLREQLDLLAKEIELANERWALLAETLAPFSRPRAETVPRDGADLGENVKRQEPSEIVGLILRQRLRVADLGASIDACIHRLEI